MKRANSSNSSNDKRSKPNDSDVKVIDFTPIPPKLVRQCATLKNN